MTSEEIKRASVLIKYHSPLTGGEVGILLRRYLKHLNRMGEKMVRYIIDERNISR